MGCIKKNVTTAGTIRLNRKLIPPKIKKVDNPIKKSTFFVYSEDDNSMFVSYIDKKKSGKKNVMILTSMHDKVKVTKETKATGRHFL